MFTWRVADAVRTLIVCAAIGGSALGLLAWHRASQPPPPGGVDAVVPGGRAAPSRPTIRPRPRDHAVAPANTYAAAFDRGVAAYNADDVEAAADAFEEAVRLAPGEPEAHINLGLIYMRLQRPEDGLRELAVGADLEQARREGSATGGAARPGGRGGTIERHDPSGSGGRR